MENFTPVSALIGGALIGAAAVLLMWFNGRIAGIAGIVGGVLVPARGDTAWRVAFLAGIVLGTLAWRLAGGLPAIHLTGSVPMLIAGGFLVGSGVRLGNGCTSGHGVCGIARGALRSVAATLTFMATAFVTVYLVRHAIGGGAP
jgi:hypothetical protein